MTNVNQALLEANAVLALKGSSFHWARYLLSQTHANRATRLYRFCRYIDDIADEATSQTHAKQALQQLSQDIKSGQARDAITQDALLLMQECAIAPEIMQALIEGVASDLNPVAMKDIDELLRYCYRVAGTVGLMMCKVLDINDERAYPFAIDLGIAMQLTNICRDVADDAKLGRRYLPATMIGHIQAADLVNPTGNIQAVLPQCLAEILTVADNYYQSGESGLSFIGLRARCGIAVAARVYHHIGIIIKQQQYQYWQGRAIVTKKTKCRVTIFTLLNALVIPSFWRYMNAHQAPLHNALEGLPMTNTLSNSANAAKN